MTNKYFEIQREEYSDLEAIRFLNSSALDFYNNKYTFKEKDFGMFFKSVLLMPINDIENTLKGAFDSGFSLNNADIKYFNQMFPMASSLFNIKNPKNLKRIGIILSKIRNLNAHAIPAWQDLEVLNYDFSSLTNIYPINKSIHWFTEDKQLTIAGVVLIVLLFLRAQSIMQMTKSLQMLSLISSGYNKYGDKGFFFVEHKSKVNLELPIRTEKGITLLESISGRYFHDINNKGKGAYSYSIKDYDEVEYQVSFKIIDNMITIRAGSYTKTYYVDDYVLEIKDVDEFMSLANQFPPFVFIDLLYELGETTFDTDVANRIKEKMDLYSKLNYPKFYIDKNIKILLLPPTQSDMRIVNWAVNGGLISILLRLESAVYEKINQTAEIDDYSTIKRVIDYLGLDSDSAFDLRAIRNFATHRSLFGSYRLMGSTLKQYSFEYVLDTLIRLKKHLYLKSKNLYSNFSNDINELFIERLMHTKYNAVVTYTHDCFKGNRQFPNPKSQDVINKFLCIDSSTLYEADLNTLFINNEKPICYIREYRIDGMEYPLFIRDNEPTIQKLKNYLSSQGTIEQIAEIDNGVIKTFLMKKN